MWNEFVELPEQQQERIVKLATEKKIRKKKCSIAAKIHSNDDDNFETFVMIENHATTNDTPMVDPLRPQGNNALIIIFIFILTKNQFR